MTTNNPFGLVVGIMSISILVGFVVYFIIVCKYGKDNDRY